MKSHAAQYNMLISAEKRQYEPGYVDQGKTDGIISAKISRRTDAILVTQSVSVLKSVNTDLNVCMRPHIGRAAVSADAMCSILSLTV